MVTSRMFPFITKTWNPLGGECQHKCSYCWAQGPNGLVEKRKMTKYRGKPRLIAGELGRLWKPTDFIFVEDMSDLFGSYVPWDLVHQVLVKIGRTKGTFLLLTKNPKRYGEFKIPENCVCGSTIETDIDFGLTMAPYPSDRLYEMIHLKYPRKMVSVEPVQDFNLDYFAGLIIQIRPEFVAVGYDNYDNKLPEPSLAKTMQLIDRLEKAGITVYSKTLREAWNERKGS